MSPAFKAWLARDGVRRTLLAEVSVRVDGVETTRYLSNTGYVSGAADAPANTIYAARLTGGFSFTRSLDIDGESGSLAFGELALDNTDGALDTWLDDVWAMRSIRLFLGSPTWARSQFEEVFVGTVEDIVLTGRSQLALRLRDILAPLDEPISTAKVGGDGDNKDTPLPLSLGECFNVEPLLISESGLATYRVSLGAVEQIVEVRDNGYPVTVTTDAAAGTFTLQYQRWGQITCDVQGATVTDAYRNDVGGLIEWLATTLGDGKKITSAEIDTTALTAFRTSCPQPVGLYLNQRTPRIQAMQELAASVGATVSASSLGKLRVVRLAFGTPTRAIGTKHMVAETFEPITRPSVRGAVTLAGCRNWTEMRKDSLAASLEPNQITILSEPNTVSASTDADVLEHYRQDDTPDEVDTLLVVEADVQAEALRRLNLWKTPRKVFRFEGWAELLDIELGDTVTLTHPRLGLVAGVPALVTSVETDFLAQRVTMEVLV